MIYTISSLSEHKWYIKWSSFIFLVGLPKIQWKIWWRMATNTESKCFYIFTNVVWNINKFYVSLIALPLFKKTQRNLCFWDLYSFFTAYWTSYRYSQAEPVTLFWEIHYTESISCHACRLKYLGEDVKTFPFTWWNEKDFQQRKGNLLKL